jgi:hypothetical protein
MNVAGARRYAFDVGAHDGAAGTAAHEAREVHAELRGDAAKVNDQLFLARGNLSDDEVLTRQRALATSFRLSGSVGVRLLS